MESVNKIDNIVKDSIENSMLDKIVHNIKFLGNIESEKIEIKKEELKENKENYISKHIYILSPN